MVAEQCAGHGLIVMQSVEAHFLEGVHEVVVSFHQDRGVVGGDAFELPGSAVPPVFHQHHGPVPGLAV